MIDGVWSGGTYVCWGTENREAPIRVCNASAPSSRNFELKAVDGTSNPYLVLAGILGVGAFGIKEKRKLNLEDICGDKSAAMMTEEQRKALGVTDRMPLSLEEARERFLGDKVVKELFGALFVEKYLAVNKVSYPTERCGLCILLIVVIDAVRRHDG
jgi:glutamine synthetase